MPVPPRRFNLQPVLNVKELREEQLQVALAVQLAEEERQRQALHALEAERRQSLTSLSQASGTGPLDLTTIHVADAYLGRVEQHVVSQAVATSEAAAATEATRDALSAAMQERKALEKLRERHRELLRQHLRQLEANQADETAITRYHRLQKGR